MAMEDEFDQYIKLSWKAFSEGVMQAQKQLMTWLFTLHGAGIAGSLSYATSRGIRCGLVVSLIAFVAGILCLLAWATLMYYFGAWRFREFKKDVDAVHAGQMTRKDFVEVQNSHPSEYRSCEIMAWISGISALVGLGALIVAILKT
jgi:hypothetical protein